MNQLTNKFLQTGQQVYFIGDNLPYTVMASTERYAICSRKINRKEDRALLEFEVERGAALNISEAWAYSRNSPVYTIVDFQEKKRAPDDRVFGIYNYSDKKDCEKALKDLIKGKINLSQRHGAELNIDWKLTNS